MAGEGLVSMKPSSISFTGTGATINSHGGVDFTSATVVSLNGVFTSSYDNYLMVISNINTSGQANITARMRVGGVDATGTNYVRQYMFVTGTSVTTARTTSESVLFIGGGDAELWSGDAVHIYGPALAQPTITRNVSVAGELGAYIQENVSSHSLSTSYDGLTLFLASQSSGNLHVFGYEE